MAINTLVLAHRNMDDYALYANGELVSMQHPQDQRKITHLFDQMKKLVEFSEVRAMLEYMHKPWPQKLPFLCFELVYVQYPALGVQRTNISAQTSYDAGCAFLHENPQAAIQSVQLAKSLK